MRSPRESANLRVTLQGAVFTLATILCCNPAAAQDEPPVDATQADENVSTDVIDNLLAQVETNADLDDAGKAGVKDRLERAKQSLANAKKMAQDAAQFEQTSAGATEQIKQTRAALAEAEKKPTPPSEHFAMDSLAERLVEAQTKLSDATAEAEKLAGEPARRRARLAKIPGELTDARKQLDATAKQLAAATPANESPIESDARRLLLQARASELQQQIELLQDERAAYVASTELLPLQQQLAAAQVTRLRSEIEMLTKLQTQRQQKQAADAARNLSRIAADAPPELGDLARANIVLAKQQQQVLEASNGATLKLDQVEKTHAQIKAELDSARQRVDSVGMTDALAAMFRERRHSLEQLRSRYRPQVDVRDKIDRLQVELYRLEDEAERIDQQLADLPAVDVQWQSPEVDLSRLTTKQGRWVLLKQRRALLTAVIPAQSELLQTVIRSDTQRHELSSAIDEYLAFVDRRLFWTRSAPWPSLSEWRKAPQTVAWLIDPDHWLGAARAVVVSFRIDPLTSLLFATVAGALIVRRGAFRRHLASQGEAAARFDADFRPTLGALAATTLSAAAWPSVLAAVSVLLTRTEGAPFTRGLGHALAAAAWFVGSRELLREACRDGGLADVHFGWSTELRKHLRRHLRWFAAVGGVAIFALFLLKANPDPLASVLGVRASAICLFLATAVFYRQLFRSTCPLYVDLIRFNTESAVYKWRKLIGFVSVLLPVALVLMAAAGYLTTVIRLGQLMLLSFLLLLVVLFALGLVFRWITLRRRDATRKQLVEARQKRMAAAQESAAAQSSRAQATLQTSPGVGEELQTQLSDLPALDRQTKQTASVLAAIACGVGLTLIWRDVLPAIQYFGEIALWHVGAGDSVEAVTLLDLFLVIVVTFALVFVARNFAGLLELMVLSRTSLDSGARYALTMLLRYVLFIVGIVVVFNLLSVPYQQLGWLLAALSVGIGFGLQEIIANFVCGVILLLERPVRVGDVVTIGDVAGTVARIQMRATTVTTWDRKELVIPNKDLITQKLLNWSLTNVVNRMTLNVGVAYGTDPDQVRDILMQVVTSHPEVLEDPPPLINFDVFGASSLDFAVRFYLPNLDHRITVTHEINTAIARAFDEAGINVPFPQRDVHLSMDSEAEALSVALDGGKMNANADQRRDADNLLDAKSTS